MTATRQLVVCCPGEGLDALRAASAAGRPFDVWAAPGGARDPSGRFAALAALLRAEAAALERYDAVWLPDADVRFDVATVERLFEALRVHGLALAQPTLADGSPGAHAFAFASEAFALRLTRLVEPSAPAFSRDALRRCLPTFDEAPTSWGVELAWPRRLADDARIALLDRVRVRRASAAGDGGWLRAFERAPAADLARLAATYGPPRAGWAQHVAGVLPDGEVIPATERRFWLLLAAGLPRSHAREPQFHVALAETIPHARPQARSDGRPLGSPRAPHGRRPSVSVVIPCYRQAEFLSVAVSSVALQSFTDWELVIVDDGSPDDTAAVANRLVAALPGRRIRLLRQRNAGLAAARNAGIRAARGRLVLPLDADDAIDGSFLARTVALLDADPDAEIAGTDGQMFGARQDPYRVNPAATLARLLAGDCLNYCSLYRREVWEAVGGYRSNMTMGYEDWDFWIGCAERGFRGVHVPEPLFFYRVKEESMLTRALAWNTHLRARIVLNHPESHLPAEVAGAAAFLRENPLPAHGEKARARVA